jgi:hypothetical protein
MHVPDVHKLAGRRRPLFLMVCALLAVPLSAQTNSNAALEVTKGNIQIAHDAVLDVSPRVTLEAWVKPSPPLQAFGTLIDKDYSYGFGFGLSSITGRTDSVKATVILAGSAISGPHLASDDATWTHLAVTIDTSLHQLVFYVNGVPAGTVVDSRVRFPNNTHDLRLGRSTLGDVYRGKCDEIRVWNVIRTAPEIASLWNHEAKGNEPGLIAVYHFEDVRDTAAWNRAKGGGLHGTFNGSGLLVAGDRPDAFTGEQESNGCYASATPVNYGSLLQSAAVAPADTDYFKIWTRAGDTFRIQSAARNAGDPADLMISIFSTDTVMHITSYHGGYPGFYSAASVNGYRYIKVINRGATEALYTLNITRREEVFVADEYEPNSTLAQAVARPWGATSYGTIFPGVDAGVVPCDSDYYAYTAKAGEIGLFIHSYQGVACGSGYARISNGSADLPSTFPSDNPNYRFPTAGTYYLKIVPNEATYRYYFGAFKVLADIHDMLYDVITVGSGTVLRSGISYAYNNAYVLRINGTEFGAAPDYASTELDGRQLVFGPATMCGLTVTRKFFVPTSAQGDTLGFVRIQDVFTNRTAAPITVTAGVSSRLGANPSKILGSSTGDTLFSTSDTWLWTDDEYPTTGRPHLLHIIDGAGGSDRADSVSLVGRAMYWEWRSITVQPGETKIYLYYHSQEVNPDVARKKGPAFSAAPLPAAATLGLGADGAHVMNWPAGLVVSSEDEPALPLDCSLEQNYPNPFNPSSDIQYQISDIRVVRIAVYDILGREVAVLVNEAKMPGTYQVRFDAAGLASGVYFCRMEARSSDPAGGGTGTFVATKAMMLVR